MLSQCCSEPATILTLEALKYFLHQPWRPNIFIKMKSSKMSLSASFEYLCYVPTAIMNILTVRGSTLVNA